MPTERIYQANQLTHRLNTLGISYPIRWNHSLQKWQIEKNQFAKFKYYLVVVVVKVILSPSAFSYLLLMNAIYPDVLKLHQIIIQFFFCLGILSSLMLDVLTFFFAEDIVQGMNSMYLLEDSYHLSNQKAFNKNISNKAYLISSFVQIKTEFKSDPAGLVILLIPILFTGFGAISTIIFTAAELDYLTLFLVFWKIPLINKYITVKIVKCLYYLIITHVLMISIRTFSLQVANLQVAMYTMLDYLLGTKRLTKNNYILYNALRIILTGLKTYLVAMLGGWMATMYLMITLGVVSTIVGLYFHQPLLVIPAFMLTFAVFVSLNVTFWTTCKIYENSIGLLRTWRNDAIQRSDRGYARRVLKAMQVLSLPAGEVGIMDRDIKINYLSAVLEDSSCMLVGCKVTHF